MFDDLLNQVLTLWPTQPAPSHMEQEIDGLALRSDSSTMATYQRLEAISLTGHPHSVANSSTPVSWQLPLPYDILFYIINSYLLDMLPTLHSLRESCRSLATLCRPFSFRTITITTNAAKLSNFKNFATVLRESPDIIDYIQNLRILDRDRIISSSKAMFDDEESLCYILARQYPNLKRMEVSIYARWLLLPNKVHCAFELAFALPSLQAISLEHVQIPIDVLSHLQSLQSLEIRCEVFPPCTYPDTHCTPKTLKYYDPRQSEYGFKNTFLTNSNLLSKLESLEIYAPARQLLLFQAHLQKCYRTLTTLKIYPFQDPFDMDTNDSFSLDLKSLVNLTSLVLFCDSWSITALHDPGRNAFWWMLNTLRTCHQPSLIDSVEIVIQLDELADTESCPWDEVERVLDPRVGWGCLKELHIRHNDDGLNWDQWGNKWNREGYNADRVILSRMPVLASMISVRFSISDFVHIHRQEVDIDM